MGVYSPVEAGEVARVSATKRGRAVQAAPSKTVMRGMLKDKTPDSEFRCRALFCYV